MKKYIQKLSNRKNLITEEAENAIKKAISTYDEYDSEVEKIFKIAVNQDEY